MHVGKISRLQSDLTSELTVHVLTPLVEVGPDHNADVADFPLLTIGGPIRK